VPNHFDLSLFLFLKYSLLSLFEAECGESSFLLEWLPGLPIGSRDNHILIIMDLLLLLLQETAWALVNRLITIPLVPRPPQLPGALSPPIPELTRFTPIKVSLSLSLSLSLSYTHTRVFVSNEIDEGSVLLSFCYLNFNMLCLFTLNAGEVVYTLNFNM
jgi:hypothetical protein